MNRVTTDVATSPAARLSAPDFFAALANDTRLRALIMLSRQGELCVCELTHALSLSQPHISRHLAQLRETGLVTDRRDGVWVYYRINEELPPWALQVLGQTARGVASGAPFCDDAEALEKMPNRPGAARCA
ncbi:MAG: metalloregulator ArsR/SmtB family transcription factor [Thiohalocapsa sp.]